MNLALQDGGVALTVKLGIGKLDTQIKTDSVRFDDNQWHHVLRYSTYTSRATHPGQPKRRDPIHRTPFALWRPNNFPIIGLSSHRETLLAVIANPSNPVVSAF